MSALTKIFRSDRDFAGKQVKSVTETTGPYSAVDIRRAQNKRKALELGRAGLDPFAIAKQVGMPLFVVRRTLTIAGIPLLPPAAQAPAALVSVAVLPTSTGSDSIPPRRRGRPPHPRPLAVAPLLPRRGPGRPRTVPREPDAPASPLSSTSDSEVDLVIENFSDYRSVTAISQALNIPAGKVRIALMSLPPDRVAAWNEFNCMRREVERIARRQRT